MRYTPSGKGFLSLLMAEKYRHIRDNFLKKNTRREVIKPLMKYREILLIEELLTNLQPQRCLEWGSGYSTLHFSQLLQNEAKWLAIEHHEDWAFRISNLNQNQNVEVVYVPPNHYPWSDEYDDGTYSDLADYIEYPKEQGPYDFILVDGRARNECLAKAYQWLSPTGVVVLHDSKRPHYHKALEPFEQQVFFTHTAYPAKGLWLGSRQSPIETYVNVRRHQRLWRFHNRARDFKRSTKQR